MLLSVKQFLKNRLKLQVNDAKSGCAPVYDRQFLGYRLLSDGRLVIAPHSVKRIEDKVRTITQRNRGVSLEQVISELNQTLRGWINYFRFTAWNSQVAELDTWTRRKVRCYRIKQRKQGRPLYTRGSCVECAGACKFWKRMVAAFPKSPNQSSLEQCLVRKARSSKSCETKSFVKHLTETAVCDIARTVV